MSDELMINDPVLYMFGNKICHADIVGIQIVTNIVKGERIGVFTERTYTIYDQHNNRIRDGYGEKNFQEAAHKRLEYLRGELQAERISYEELAELQGLVKYIDPSDVELLEATGVPEHEENNL